MARAHRGDRGIPPRTLSARGQSTLQRRARRRLALFCPITSRVKGYPFEVGVPKNLAVTGVVLADQIKSLDWRARRAEFADRLPDPELGEVTGMVMALLGEGGA